MVASRLPATSTVHSICHLFLVQAKPFCKATSVPRQCSPALTTDALGTTQFKGGILSAVTTSINDPLTLTSATAISGRTLQVDKGLTYNSATDGQLELRIGESARFNQPIVQTSAGKLSLMQNGTGITTLQGANTFAGDTTVQLGELALDVGASLSGNVILAGGKLVGKGKVTGTTTQAPGSAVSPGASPGILAISGNLQFANEGQLKVEINGLAAGTEHDQVLADGIGQTVDLGRVNLLVSLGYAPNLGDRFTVVRLSNTTSTLIGSMDDAQGTEIVDGGVFTAGGYQFEVDYRTDADGDGALNDVTFTVIDYARDFGSALILTRRPSQWMDRAIDWAAACHWASRSMPKPVLRRAKITMV